MVNVVSTFCGCGGSSLGYKLAGCNVILATDYEEKAIQTYNLNFPNTKTLVANIRDLTGHYIKRHTKLEEIDILDGSPPCTPFSLAGKRERKWNKEYVSTAMTHAQRTDDLFFEFIRLVKECNPKVFLAENVKGLIIGKAKGYYNLILQEMRKLNYVIEPYILNAKYYEVPQSRDRIIFVGFRKDLKLNTNVMLRRHRLITVKEALQFCQSTLEEIKIATRAFYNSIHYKDYVQLKQGKGHDHHFSKIRLSENNPACTLTAHTSHDIIHPIKHRFLTLSEFKRLQTFPDNFRFLTIHEGFERLGNSVPPNLIKNIVKHILEKVDYFGVAPNQKVTT